ncbi:probable serine/threonine-protein kinase At1g54610 isoform X1 [Coffea arabica]|uniref:Probable serine/threonine-protein kinase At1g54610 isoform X1 n=1 Tax=Coffea arabica TaxID=13443 RepID=A0A6P6SEA9_COFAR|nr:probable serine/threonine-protein kinase At1g54610 isoform X1 [Coffea arabica]
MGNLCGKSSSTIKDGGESPNGRKLAKASSQTDLTRAVSSRRDESFRLKKKFNSGEIKIHMIDRKLSGSRRVRDDYYDKNKENSGALGNYYPGPGSVPKGLEGEQVAAGWPSWLASAAGEAIKGWLPRKADTFEKLDKIGQGTYSSVYKARDLTRNKLVALKRVRFDNMDTESVKFMAREILILRRLDHPNVIKLEGLVASRTSSSLYLVLEYMEHDLTGLASLPGVRFSEPQVKCYMQQLLSGLDHCHTHSVLHRDIKGSNLLLDNHGCLKIADFGLATSYDRNQKIPLTSRVVTLWYRPPELLLGASHYGAAVDLWSAGCILGELYAGKPIMPGRTEVEQLHKIFKLCGSPSEEYWRKAKLPHSTVFRPQQTYKRHLTETFKDFPPAAMGLMETLLSIDPAERGSAAVALKSEFFKTEPFACDPSTLPKYPPSKEIDAKLREEEAKRQGAQGVKGSKDLRAVPVPDANAELVSSMKRNAHSKNRSEQFNRHKEETSRGFPADPPRLSKGVIETRKATLEHPPQRVSYSGPLGPASGWAMSGKKYDDISFVSNKADLSTLSGLVASRTLPSEDSREKYGSQQVEIANQVKESLNLSGEPMKKHDQKRRMENLASSHHLETGRATKGPVLQGHPSKATKIHFSGPLGVPPNKVDQMLKEHDRQLQEAVRRTRIERTRVGKVEGQEMQMTANPVYASTQGVR